MIRLGLSDPRPWALAPGSAIFYGTLGPIVGVVSIARLKTGDRSICVPLTKSLLRPTDLYPSINLVAGRPLWLSVTLDIEAFPPIYAHGISKHEMKACGVSCVNSITTLTEPIEFSFFRNTIR